MATLLLFSGVGVAWAHEGFPILYPTFSARLPSHPSRRRYVYVSS